MSTIGDIPRLDKNLKKVARTQKKTRSDQVMFLNTFRCIQIPLMRKSAFAPEASG